MGGGSSMPTLSGVAPAAVGKGSGIGYGCMGITAFYGEAMATDAAVELLKGVYAGECRHFDTAEIYKTGNPFEDDATAVYNEAVVGKFLSTVPRDTYTVATKYMPYKYGGKCDYETVKASLERSLDRLGLAHVDLYYCHRVPSKEGTLEFCEAAKKLKEEGLIRGVGLSECCAEWLRAAHSVTPITAIQQEWSLLSRSAEADLLPACAELGVTIVAYSPLARNLLAKKVEEPPKDWRATLPRYAPEALEANAKVFDAVQEIATAKKLCAPAALSLAWLFFKAAELGVSVVPIPGTTTLSHALENIEAAKITITKEEAEKLETLAQNIVGERGDEGYMKMGFEGQK